MIDDTERSGETNTVAEMMNVLKKNGIAYGIGKSSGERIVLLSAAQI